MESVLTEVVTSLAVRVMATHDLLVDFKDSSTAAIEQLEIEIQNQKRLSKYQRRTWFWVMSYIYVAGLLTSDLLTHYAHSGWWDLVFWTSQHGHGGPWEFTARVVGFTVQASFLFFMTKRAQVPANLFDRTAHGVQVGLRSGPRASSDPTD